MWDGFNQVSKDTSYVLAPRLSGYRALLEGMKDNLHEVWDLTLCYSGKPPYLNTVPSISIFGLLLNDWDYIWDSSIGVHVYVKRWKYEELQVCFVIIDFTERLFLFIWLVFWKRFVL